ncbi:hypothetical protein [Beijerinckia sp. L45]|uniref:hypothetical protein n=1 Tax=Beijerinckia sp. L45 TaxID=1641855 RepID=UPI00131B6D61|nr:hypothetical protein [Beijerinckia sp. L45]
MDRPSGVASDETKLAVLGKKMLLYCDAFAATNTLYLFLQDRFLRHLKRAAPRTVKVLTPRIDGLAADLLRSFPQPAWDNGLQSRLCFAAVEYPLCSWRGTGRGALKILGVSKLRYVSLMRIASGNGARVCRLRGSRE